MTRKIAIILLFVVGVVCIASGIWGFSLRSEADVDATLLGAAETVLSYADSALETADSAVSDWTGGKLNVTGLLNSLVGDAVDLTDQTSMTRFALLYSTELVMGGIICIETALLLRRKSGK